MATYAMTIDERSTQGKALLTYLGTLDIKLQPLTHKVAPCQFSKKEMLSLLMVLLETSMMVLFLQLKLLFQEISEELWLGLINIED